MRTVQYTVLAAAAAQSFTAAQPVTAAAVSTSGFTDAYTHSSVGGNSSCVSGFVQVEANTTKNVLFNYQIPLNQSQVTQTIVSQWTPGANYTASIKEGTQSVNGTYSIRATLCMPPNSSPTKVQLLTHGIAFDSRYWDIAPGYSYVDVATAAGYATFAYDRLGTGLSDKPDPITVVQQPFELAILDALAGDLRQGSFANVKYAKIVGVGHSYGSALTQGLTAAFPKAVDAAVLTGFSTNASGMPTFNVAQIPTIASLVNPYLYNNLSNGYVVVGSQEALQTTFLHAPGFDPRIAALGYDLTSTISLAEYFTAQLGAVVAPAPSFTGPLAVVNGNNDLAFCFGDCSYPTNISAEVQAALYPNVPSSKFTTYRAPNSGHGLNFHYSSAGAFTYIQTFLSAQGL